MAKLSKYQAISKFTVVNEIAKQLFSQNKLHCLPLYVIISQDKRFSGVVRTNKLPLLADILNCSISSLYRQLNDLQRLGMIEDWGENTWHVFAADDYCAARNIIRCKRTDIPENINSYRELKAFIVSIIYSECYYRSRHRLIKRKSKRVLECPDALKIELSASYCANYMRKEYGSNISKQEISKLRRIAKHKGFTCYDRQITWPKRVTGKGKKIYTPAECLPCSDFEGSEGGAYVLNGKLVVEHSALFYNPLKFRNRSVPSNLIKKYSHYRLSKIYKR